MAYEAHENGGWKDEDIVRALHTGQGAVERARQKCMEMVFEAAINHTRPKRTRTKVLDGTAEARLVQLG